MVALIVFFHIYIRAVSHHVSSIFPLSKMYIYPKARHRHKSAVIHFVWVHFQLYFYQRNCVIYVRFYPRNVLLKYTFLVRKRSAAVNYDLGQNKTKKNIFCQQKDKCIMSTLSFQIFYYLSMWGEKMRKLAR